LIINALKSDEDSNILATPFILADDNQENSISVTNEIFYTTSSTSNINVTTSQQSESAGITLNLIPTISSEVVLLELNLEVSSFSGVSDGTGALPDRSTNVVNSKVTIPDGGMFIIGGLAQMAQSEIQSKVPFLGDLPFLGPLFQSSGSNTARDNLYVFLSAHIMDDANYNGLGNFTKDAIEGVRSFDDDIRLQQFTDPDNARDASQQDQITVEGASEEEMTP
ncbi:MAG: type II and III secretion system protein, partial [Planctomycetes bacterium]|nr:type II and III secretion system protein [Planctomycetota bacterium]